jgi:hypothetical protein
MQAQMQAWMQMQAIATFKIRPAVVIMRRILIQPRNPQGCNALCHM